jgi:dephospho-CoA kinase
LGGLLNLKKLAVTGGIASGKTSVCRILKEQYGAYVVSADAIVHQLLSLNTPERDQILNFLGKEIICNGQIDRKKIAAIVFSDEKKLKKLEKILHPSVFREIDKQYQAINESEEYSLFVAEVPLLYESDKASWFDWVIAVIADDTVCRQRFSSAEEYDRRMQYQLPQREKAAKANWVIINNGKIEELEKQVGSFINALEYAK